MGYRGDKDAEELSKEIAGAIVRSVVRNTNSEGMFTVKLERDGKNFEVRIYGTDLGWWFEAAGNRG